MRGIKLAMLVLIAILAVGAVAAASAVASHPEFKTESGKTLLFTGEGGLAVLLGERAGSIGEILCHKVLLHGEILNGTPLIDKVTITFHTNCISNSILGDNEKCKEPIEVHPVRGEIGLVPTKLVGLYLTPYNGTEFVTVECGSNDTTVDGSIVGLVPEKVGTTNQYNKVLTKYETRFEASGVKQRFTEIELLGTNMTGDELSVTGLFGGQASEITNTTLAGDGGVEINTSK